MNGYIQLELGGKLRALKFNMHAIELISQKGTTTEHGNLTVFIYAGLCGNSFAKSAGSMPLCEESFEEVSEWAEDLIVNRQDDIKLQIMTAFSESKPIKKQAEDRAEEDKKKAESLMSQEILLGNQSTNTPLESSD